MVIGTAALLTVGAKLLSPIVSDLYKNAKEATVTGLKRWDASGFAEKLAMNIYKLGMVRTIWSKEEEVALLDFYYPPNVSSQEKRTKKLLKNVVKLGSFGKGNLVIEGVVGQGKSMLLRYLSIKEASTNQSLRIPIFIELRTLLSSFTLLTSIYKYLEAFDIDVDDKTFDYLAKSGRFVLLLDGFDELDKSLIVQTLNEISHLALRYPGLQIVVTSRPDNEIQKLAGFKVFNLCKLEESDFAPFLSKLGVDVVKNLEICEAIKKGPSRLSTLISTPLMLTLVVIVYEYEKEIPSTLSEFFEQLFHVVFTTHDRLKAGFTRTLQSGLSERKLQSLFEAFCFMVLQNGFGRSLSREKFTIAFESALEYVTHCSCDEQKFKHDIVKITCLMLEEGIDRTTFLHMSILEYYAAAFVKHSEDDVAEIFYKSQFIKQLSWNQVLRFLKEIDSIRFAREFTLPELNAFRTEIIESIDWNSDKSINEAIQAIAPQLRALFEKSDKDLFEFRLGVAVMGSTSFFKEMFFQNIVEAVLDAAPEKLTLAELKGMANFTFSETEELQVPILAIISYRGTSEFRRAFDLISQKITIMVNEANAILSAQEKKRLIFERNTKIQSAK
ncbi:NACHT domain-containing protein [Undibacterium umbellatum]|uniref:NACHT domain-containing protein n=1 Tax=Undibacterium umbellatum TaxID=2762300 RepID=A0ABR6ZIU6_9BURK|nr:NACHT domain-containing protein [Undibacterium umbellatum]MBC3911609.1 NACHT domain-containing protein [Undibacterium umbellatum]